MSLKKKIPLIAKCLLLIFVNFAMPALFSSAACFDKKNTPLLSITSSPLSNITSSPLSKIASSLSSTVLAMYNMLSLDSLGLSEEAFKEAITGYQNLLKSGTVLNNTILSIVDFSLPSYKKRLFVLDMENGKLLFNTLVAHGRNSGQLYATRFSNRNRSLESSLGFYLTGETYVGQNGYSLRLLGMEHGFNDNAYSRGIVIHPADYVNDEISKTYGRLGRSEGCPAIPSDIHRSVIETIKNGSCFFVYGKDRRYASRSKLLKNSRLS
jgi:L,D-transpeptidase catalytic domain